jgi:hypothetical protein
MPRLACIRSPRRRRCGSDTASIIIMRKYLKTSDMCVLAVLMVFADTNLDNHCFEHITYIGVIRVVFIIVLVE